MPALNNEILDDPLVFDAMPDFSGGMVSNRPASSLEEMQYFLGVNLDIKTKLAVTRRGTSSQGSPIASRIQGLQYFSTPSYSYMMAAANGHIYTYNDISWSAALAGYTAAGGASVQICMAQLIDTVYIADQTSNLFSWDGAAMADLGTGGANQPPKGNIIISHMNRLWCAGSATVPDQLNCSTALATSWDKDQLSIRVGGGEGDPITGLAPLDTAQLVVFKRNSIYIVTIDNANLTGADAAHGLGQALISKVSDVIGCVSHRSIAVVGADVWFLSDTGVRSLRRVLAQNTREISLAVSEPINDVIDRINAAQIVKCSSAYWDNKYILSVPLDSSTEPDTVLVYDTLRQAWAGYWTGWTPLIFALSKLGGNERLNFGLPSGTVLRWLDYVASESEDETTFQDAGVNVSSTLATRGFVFGDGYSDKSLFSVEATFYQSEDAVDITLAFEQGVEMPLATSIDSRGGIPLLLPFTLPAIIGSNQVKRRKFPCRQFNRFRELQVVARCQFGKMALRAIACAAFPLAVTPQQ